MSERNHDKQTRVLLPMTVSHVEAVLLFLVTLLVAMQVYSPLMLKLRWHVSNMESLPTRDPLKYQV